jgi:flavin-dependent dehydrogenase
MRCYDAAVVGAGPAGSAAAATLARRSRRVLLIEKDRFPRAKVCGEFLSAGALASLDRLNLRGAIDALRPESIERGRLHLPHCRSIEFQIPRPALGLSRFALDDLLARGAEAAGAEVRFDTRVDSIERAPQGYLIREAGPDGAVFVARAVIGAWGRWDSLDRSLNRSFLSRSSRFLGWSRDYSGDTSFLAGLVQLFAFPGGYCGLSRVERGTAHLAGVISEETRARVGGGWEAVIAHARGSNGNLDQNLARLHSGSSVFLGTGPVFFTRKPAVEDGMLMSGDAAGFLDPFSGEGQSTALASGILAAETIERGLSGELSWDEVMLHYATAWRAQFGRRFAWGRLLRYAMLHPWVGTLAARVAGERVLRAALRGLTAPTAPLLPPA